MADEDEIDVLGDFSLDNLLTKNESTMFDHSALVSQNTDLLNCDYTIHPQWLLDKPSTNPACWYNTSSSAFTAALSNDSSLEYSNSANDNAESITDESGWTEKEKDLLNRGIEIFGKSHVRLAQFIGSKSASEIKYFLKNFYSDVQLTCTDVVFDGQETSAPVASSLLYNEVLDDTEIPASIEEVIAVVTTAKPTFKASKLKKIALKSEVKVAYNDIPCGHSVLKRNFVTYSKPRVNTKGSKEKRGKDPNMKTAMRMAKFVKNIKKSVKFKFKAKIKIPPKVTKMKLERRKSTKSESSIKSEASDVEIVTGNGLSVPVCNGEQVIKIQKENGDIESDFEIDVEDAEDLALLQSNSTKVQIEKIESKASENVEKHSNLDKIESQAEDSKKEVDFKLRKGPEIGELADSVVEQLKSLNVPIYEVMLDYNVTSDLEKFLLYEFFEGRIMQTPERYLKIRNHIINLWKASKPAYITKTSIRNGLKHCGDVNCIGRVHNFLEQIGAINFGCAQTSYVRPLSEFMNLNANSKENSSKELDVSQIKWKMDLSRPRFKRKYVNDGDGGCTITHNEKGDVINTTVVNEEPIQKPRSYIKKPTIRLIYCRSYTENNPQKFTIQLHLSVLLLMDLHAHTSLTEVMGLVGGYWKEDTKTLTITRYEPCRNIAPSSTHCDMCPITQAKAANKFHNENLNILGWFHSHPTFAPEPSQQDLETQLSVQQWIGHNKPCIGVILSPFSLHGALIGSPYRCMIVDKKENSEHQLAPYKFKVELVSNNVDVDRLLNRAWRIFNSDCHIEKDNRVNFNKSYYQDHSITYLEKFISSIKMHLAKCSDINKMTCDAIVEGLSKICCHNL